MAEAEKDPSAVKSLMYKHICKWDDDKEGGRWFEGNLIEDLGDIVVFQGHDGDEGEVSKADMI